MKLNFAKRLRRSALVVLCSFGCTSLFGAAATTATATNAAPNAAEKKAVPAIEQVTARKSVFEEKPQFRDPFYPKSTRRAPQQPVVPKPGVPVLPGTPEPPPPKPVVQLILQSIIISPTKRQCTINGEIFKAGEEAEVMSGTAKIKVRVIEIRKSSVVIQADGENKELRLPE
jgi:hypothetical protein